MKLLAISDTYIPYDYMEEGLAGLAALGVEVETRRWEHATLVELQEANLIIENGGPEALALPPEIMAGLEEFDFVVAQFAPIGRAFIDAAMRLKAIGVLRSGAENVDVARATERGIAVLNTPGRNARAVAECSMGLLLSEIRNIARSHACLKNGEWARNFPNNDAIPEIRGKTVGLVGYGAVGQLMAGYLEAFGAEIIAFDPYFQGDPSPARLVDLDTLLRESDVVSMHARLTEETRHLIGERELGLMKSNAIIVNTARSGLIDEEAMTRALQEKRIMGAALDVFDSEPLPPDHPLVQLDNVTLTPHLAGSTCDAFRNSPKQMAQQMIRMMRGEQNIPVINGVAWSA